MLKLGKPALLENIQTHSEGQLRSRRNSSVHPDMWGDEQADRYMELLLDGVDLVAQKPGIGRECDQLYLGLRRIERGKQIIFDSPSASGRPKCKECYPYCKGGR